ncbi:MAG: tetratricopeptide repeat protein [Ardenticatenaceae bacterium]|nr:tetratricopeptide repeat protein [Ardenticatenaceae bacterium]
MPAKSNAYLVQLRDQIAKTFNLEELKAMAFELNLDWDELHGARKTIRIQDMITQLARNGRLAELIYLLRKKRPRKIWPKAPSPERQKRDIRTAFPNLPVYQKASFWGLTTIIIVLTGIILTAWFGNKISSQNEQLPATLKAANPTATPQPEPTITPSPTPLFEPEEEGETLIVIGTFFQNEGVPDIGAHDEIRRAIDSKIDELQIENVRVEVEKNIRIPSTGLEEEQELAKQLLGEQYNASFIIWGHNSGIRTEVRFINLKDPEFGGAESTISETDRSQLAKPDAYSQFIVEDLPNQLVFLSLYALAQTEFTRSNHDKSLELLEAAIDDIANVSELDASNLDLDAAYFRLGWHYQTTNRSAEAINAYTQAININPEHANALGNRGSAYGAQGNYELALADFNLAISLNPDFDILFHNRAAAYRLSGMYEEAIQDYSQAIVLNSELAAAYLGRGRTYSQLGELHLAINDFSKTITLSPDRADTYYYRGNAYRDLGDYENAIVDYRNVLELSPESSRREDIENTIEELEAELES